MRLPVTSLTRFNYDRKKLCDTCNKGGYKILSISKCEWIGKILLLLKFFQLVGQLLDVVAFAGFQLRLFDRKFFVPKFQLGDFRFLIFNSFDLAESLLLKLSFVEAHLHWRSLAQ